MLVGRRVPGDAEESLLSLIFVAGSRRMRFVRTSRMYSECEHNLEY